MSVGDVDSNDRGSGARYNDHKPDISLIPVRLWAEMWGTYRVPSEWASFLSYLADFQEGQYEAIHECWTLVSSTRVETIRVFMYGQEKYSAWNWLKGMNWSIPLACIGRHLDAIIEGEEIDPESGRAHWGHIGCNVCMLVMFISTFPEGNDLPDPKMFKGEAN